MANLFDEIADHVFGDAFTVEKTITDIPNGVSLTKAWFSIRLKDALNNKDTLDAKVVLQKEITSVAAASGQITNTGTGVEPDRVAAVLFKIATGNTLIMVEGVNYTWDIQVLADNGDIKTPFKGAFKGQYGVTVRSS